MMKESEISWAMNAYAQRYGKNPFATFGDRVNFIKVDDCPIRRCTVKTQYEKRDTKLIKEAKRNSKYERLSPFGSSVTPDPWSYRLAPAMCDNEHKTYTIKDSYHYEDCNHCHGNGRTVCHSCHGKTPTACAKCHGTGLVTCHQCHGMGYFYYEGHKVTCPLCAENHGTPSYAHRPGYLRCDCQLGGKAACRTCHGSGYETCSVCKGVGGYECHYEIVRDITTKSRSEFVCDPRVAKVQKSAILAPVFKSTDQQLGGGMYPQDPECSATLATICTAMKASGDGTVVLQEAVVEKADACWCQYEYEAEFYEGIVCNGVFTPLHNDSPVEKWRRKKIKQAQILNGFGLCGIANVIDSKVRGGNYKIGTKLGRVFATGFNFAFWALLLIGTPLVFWFYHQLDPVATWAYVANNPDWFCFNYLPYVQAAIFMMALVFGRKAIWGCIDLPTDHELGFPLAAFLAGALQMVLPAVGFAAVFAGLNYLGLALVTTFAAGIVIYAVLFVIGIFV